MTFKALIGERILTNLIIHIFSIQHIPVDGIHKAVCNMTILESRALDTADSHHRDLNL